MPPRRRTSSTSSASSSKKSTSSLHSSQPAKFGIQHFFERHSQAAAAAAASSSTPHTLSPPPSQSPGKTQELARLKNDGAQDELSPISPEATKQAPIKRVRFSPGMIIKQSQDDGGDEVTWKISPMNQRLRSFAGKILQGTDTTLSSSQKPSVLGVCKNASGQKKFTSSPTQLAHESAFESAKKSSSRQTEYCDCHDAENDIQTVGTVDDSYPFRTPPSALHATKELGAAVGRHSASQHLDSHHQRKALLELLDQVGDAINVDEQPSGNFRSSLVESQKLYKVCGSSETSLVDNPTRAACQAPNIHMFLLLEVSEKHGDDNTLHQEKPSKVLRLLNEQSGQERILHLRDEWFYSSIKPGDTVGVIGEFDSNGECVVDRNNNLLILHPDILVSGTRVASSYSCPRQAVLDERLKPKEHSISSLLGTLLHQIFQAGLLKDFPTREFLEEYATIVLQKNIETLYACDVSENEIYAKLIEAIPRMLNWYNSYKKQASERTSVSFGSDGENLFNITEVMDIEEMAWAPRYGLKGVIDASICAKVCSNSDVLSEKLMPLEFKTGKGTTGQTALEHQVQLILYTLLMSDRYLKGDIDSGLLYYLYTDQTIGIKVQRSDLVGTIMQRNDLATGLLNAYTSQALPSMLKSPSICKSCRHLSICAVYHKAQGGCAASSGLGQMFDFHVKHLTPTHCRFLLQWDRLIDLEAKESLVARNGLLCSNDFSREQNRSSLSCLLLDVTNEFSVKKFPENCRLNYQFGRQELLHDNTIMDVHKVIEKPAKSSFDCTLRCGDHVILSTESGRIAVANGIIASINCKQVTVSLSRRLRLPGSSPSTEKADLLREVWRIDKDEITSSYAVMRFNLMQLFMRTSESTHLRKLIVDLETPRFESGCIFSQDSAISYVMSEKSLNDDQQRAVRKIITAKDYALILGMPGTGKTSTMVHAVKALLTRGASILLTSYTNSAVDNLLLKLKAQGIDFIRIGRPEAVHHDIRGHCVSAMKKCSVEEFKQKMASARVVGVTCLGINQSLLANKRFDICIMDEAGQTTLPVSLGPLMFASTFVLVGDHYQLPPLVQSVEALENGMGISLFCRLSEAHPQAIAALGCQYRMCAGIMQLSNALIYGNRLCCGSSDVANAMLKISFAKPVALWLQEILDPRMPIVFVDTDALPAPELKEHKKINNPIEAYIISKITAELLDGNVAADEIGIITPYNTQADLIRQFSRPEVEIHTIDRYQGRDKDCIILSFVRSSVVSSMLSSSLLGDWRRINVALTRAKKKLVMVGSCMTLSRIPFLKLLIEEVNRYGHVFTISKKDIHHLQELKKCSEKSA